MHTKTTATSLIGAVSLFLCPVAPAAAQVSIGIGLPNVSIGINIPLYPDLAPVPGYPVYYAPGLNSNYFFYDGMYWVYQGDRWYASSWYNGPWGPVAPQFVPVYLLRVPVRYYREPPPYFHGWRSDAPPHWGEHWGHEWEQRRSGWDHWNHKSAPRPAPLPVYQRQYSGDRYPRVEQQQALQSQHYRYQPHDPAVRQHYQAQRVQSRSAPAPPVQRSTAGSAQHEPQGQNHPQHGPAQQQRQQAPHQQRQHPQQGSAQQRQQAPHQQQPHPQQGSAQQHQQAAPRSYEQQAAPQGNGGPPGARGGNESRKQKSHGKKDEHGPQQRPQ
jgi:hypothetical protein